MRNTAEKLTNESNRVELPLAFFMENEFAGLIQIFDTAAHLSGSIYLDSTAVKVPEALYRSVLISRVRLLSEEYLLNYKRSSLDFGLLLGTSAYSNFNIRGTLAARHLAEEEELEEPDVVVRLPPYANVNAPLGITIRQRRSVREMSGKQMSLQTLSTLLFYGDGVTGELEVVSDKHDTTWPKHSLAEPAPMATRAAPGGGGLYPLKLHLVLQNVEKLQDGLYVYLPHLHALRRLRAFDDSAREAHTLLSRSWGPNLDGSRVNVAIYYVYSLFDNSRKYGDLGLNFALIEAGQIAENIHLTSTAVKLASCDVGGWEKVQSERFLSVDGLTQHLVHLTVVGIP